jgi:hypothetical protein
MKAALLRVVLACIITATIFSSYGWNECADGAIPDVRVQATYTLTTATTATWTTTTRATWSVTRTHFVNVSRTVTQTKTFLSVGTQTIVTECPLYILISVTLLALVIVAAGAYVLGRRTRKPAPAIQPTSTYEGRFRPLSRIEIARSLPFEVSVSVPSVGKTVALEVAPDHTVGSLVETLASTLGLPKNRAYAVEHAGKLIGQPDFGKSIATFAIKEGSKLSLRVVD